MGAASNLTITGRFLRLSEGYRGIWGMFMKKVRRVFAIIITMTIIGSSACLQEPEDSDLLASEENDMLNYLSTTVKDRMESDPLINNTYFASINDIDYEVYELYITVYPTYSDEGELITREIFELHKSYDKTYNPTLNCSVWMGNPDKEVNELAGTIRVRGNASRGHSTKSFKIKLTEQGAEIFGTDSLNINKHMADTTRTANKACMDLMQFMQQGFVSIDTKFIHLYMNDVNEDGTETGFQDQGLYTYAEQPNADFLVNHGLDPNGSVYKPIEFEFRLYEEVRTEDDSLYNEELFHSIIKPMVNPDHNKLKEMLEAVNNYSLDFSEVMEKYFDEENYLTWMAFNILLGNQDALAHNFLLYSPSNSDKWYLFPWDYDGAFSYFEIEDFGTLNYQTFGIHYYWTTPLHQRYFKMKGNIEKLNNKMDEIMQIVLNETNVTYVQGQSISIIEPFFLKGVDTQLSIEFYIDRGRTIGTSLLELDDPGSYLVEEITDEIHLWYDTIKNNYTRYYLNLDSPTSGHIQAPVMEDGKYVFRWDASNDFQGESITYDFQIASDYLFHEVLVEETGIRVPVAVCDSLPEGHLFYRYIARDESGNVQYPLNKMELRDEDGELIIRYYGMGYLNNGATGDYVP